MRLFIIGMVTVLILSGCGGGDGTDEPSDASDGELTIQDFIPGAIAFNEDDAEQQYLPMEREAQEAIATCMAEQGFEYIPYVPSHRTHRWAVSIVACRFTRTHRSAEERDVGALRST